MVKISKLTLCFLNLLVCYFLCRDVVAQETNMNNYGIKKIKHIVLLGASVGKAWDISQLPERIGNHEYTFEYVGEYSFDKTEKLMNILYRKQNKPDAIIIKECAAFFPGNLKAYQDLIIKWVEPCRKENVVPILTTVVPVVDTFPLRMFLINLLHKKLYYPNNVLKSIIIFNDWIKEFAKKENLVVLDLESAVRISNRNRHLRNNFAKKDGLHLNDKAYKKLDKIIIPTLNKINWER